MNCSFVNVMWMQRKKSSVYERKGLYTIMICVYECCHHKSWPKHSAVKSFFHLRTLTYVNWLMYVYDNFELNHTNFFDANFKLKSTKLVFYASIGKWVQVVHDEEVFRNAGPEKQKSKTTYITTKVEESLDLFGIKYFGFLNQFEKKNS